MSALQQQQTARPHPLSSSPLSNVTSVRRLLSLLVRSVIPAHNPHASPLLSSLPHHAASQQSSSVSQRVSRAYDVLLNHSHARVADDDEDDNIAENGDSAGASVTAEERKEPETDRAQAKLPAPAPSRPTLRLRDELATFLFLLRSHSQFHRANAVQLLLDQLREQRTVTVPASFFPPPPSSLAVPTADSAASSVPFTAHDNVVLLLLALAGSERRCKPLPPALLLRLQELYEHPPSSTAFVLPSAFSTSSPLSASAAAISSLLQPHAKDRGADEDEAELPSLEQEAWMLEKRLHSAAAVLPLPPFLPTSPFSLQPARFSFQRSKDDKQQQQQQQQAVKPLEDHVFFSAAVLPSPFPALSSSPSQTSFLQQAIVHQQEEQQHHRRLRQRQRQHHADDDVALFNRDWQLHCQSLRQACIPPLPLSPSHSHGASSSHLPLTVWEQVSCASHAASQHASVQRPRSLWEKEGDRCLPFSPASLSLFSHPQLFDSLYAASLSHLFLPEHQNAALRSAERRREEERAVVRASLLALQAVPSSLYLLRLAASSASSSLSVAASCRREAGAAMMRLMEECAETGSCLSRIELLSASLSASSDSVSHGLASSLLHYASQHRQQVDAIPALAMKRRAGAAFPVSISSTITMLELHSHAQPLQQHMRWLHDTLQTMFPSLSPSASASSLPASRSQPAGVALISALYQHCLCVPTHSSFHPTVCALFHAALTPFLLELQSVVFSSSSIADSSEMVLPSFLLHLHTSIAQDRQQLRLLTSQWQRCCECGLPVLTVAYTVRDAHRLQQWRQELQAEQERRLRAMEQGEMEKKQTAREQAMAARRRLAREREERKAAQSDAVGEEAEEEERRRRQREYQQQLDAQVEEKQRRAAEQKQREKEEREREEQQRQRELAVIEEEKQRLQALIQQVNEGKDERTVRWESWRRRREEGRPRLEAFVKAQVEDAQTAMAATAAAGQAVREQMQEDEHDSYGEEEEEDSSGSEYHADEEEDDDEEGERRRAQPPRRPPPLSSVAASAPQRRAFAFSIPSPISAPSPSSSSLPHLFSPSPKHRAVSQHSSDVEESAFVVPSPRAGRSRGGSAASSPWLRGAGGGSESEGGDDRRGSVSAIERLSPTAGHVYSSQESSPAARGGATAGAAAAGKGRRRFAFDSLPSPRSGAGSLTSNSPDQSPRRAWRDSADSLSSSAATSGSERPTPRAATAGGAEKPVDAGDADRPVTAATAGGEESDTRAEYEPALRTESEQSRAAFRLRNMSSSISFSSHDAADDDATQDGRQQRQQEEEQQQLIRLMEAKEAQRGSNEGRAQARERNVASQLFGAVETTTSRRDESDALVANRQRMMASSVFPEAALPVVEEEEQPQPALQPSRTSQELPASVPAHQNDDSAPVAAVVPPSDPTVQQSAVEVQADNSSTEGDVDGEPASPPVDVSRLCQRLPVDVAVRTSLLSALQSQHAMIERVVLSFFLQQLDIRSHLQMLQRCFLMQAGDLLDSFTSAVFLQLKRQPRIAFTSTSLLQHWQDAAHLSSSSSPLCSLVSFSVSSSLPCAAFTRIDNLQGVDCVRMRYEAEHPVSVVVTQAVQDAYGRVFSLLLRVLWVRSEMRALFLCLQQQDADIRNREAEQQRIIQDALPQRGKEKTKTAMPAASSSSSSFAAAAAKPVAATDDLFLLSPSKRRTPSVAAGAAFPFSPSRDDDISQRQRQAVAAARLELELLINLRWRLRWLHAVRAEMMHALHCIHHHLHITVIATQAAAFIAAVDAQHLRSLPHLLSLHSSFLSTLLASLSLSSPAPSPLSSLLEATLSTIVTFASSAPAALTQQRAGEEEGWEAVRDVGSQFRSQALLMARVLRLMREEAHAPAAGGDSGGLPALETSLDFNSFYSRLRQRELEATVLHQ